MFLKNSDNDLNNLKIQIKPPKRLTARQRDAILEFAKDEDFKGTINENEKGVFDKIKDKFTS